MSPCDRHGQHEEAHPARRKGAIVDIPAKLRALEQAPSMSLINVVDGAMVTVNLARMTQFEERHVHLEHDELLFFLEGSEKFELAGEVFEVRVGDLVYVPAGVPHTPVVRQHAVVLTVFGPRLGAPDRIVVGREPDN